MQVWVKFAYKNTCPRKNTFISSYIWFTVSCDKVTVCWLQREPRSGAWICRHLPDEPITWIIYITCAESLNKNSLHIYYLLFSLIIKQTHKWFWLYLDTHWHHLKIKLSLSSGSLAKHHVISVKWRRYDRQTPRLFQKRFLLFMYYLARVVLSTQYHLKHKCTLYAIKAPIARRASVMLNMVEKKMCTGQELLLDSYIMIKTQPYGDKLKQVPCTNNKNIFYMNACTKT